MLLSVLASPWQFMCMCDILINSGHIWYISLKSRMLVGRMGLNFRQSYQ